MLSSNQTPIFVIFLHFSNSRAYQSCEEIFESFNFDIARSVMKGLVYSFEPSSLSSKKTSPQSPPPQQKDLMTISSTGMVELWFRI